MSGHISALTALGLALTISSAQAETLRDVQQATEAVLSRADNGMTLCFPPVQGPASAHVIDAHSGSKFLDPNGPKDGPTVINVNVEETADPAIIVLSGSQPIVWRIRADSNANIVGVHLTGENEQFITGLAEGIPVGRSFKEQRFGTKTSTCLNRAKAAVGNPDRERLRALDQEMITPIEDRFILEKRLLLAQSRVRELTAIESDLKKHHKTSRAWSIFNDMLQKENATIAELEEKQREVWQKFDTLLGEIRPLQQKLGHQTRGSRRLHRLIDVQKYVKRLQDIGDFQLASYERYSPNFTTQVTISDAAVSAFNERQREGKRILEDVEIPTFPILPSETPLLMAPKNLTGEAGLKFLTEKGYLRRTYEAAQYVCDKRRAVELVEGIEPLETCKDVARFLPSKSADKTAYTVLGPIVMPDEVCRTAFYLPPGVARPKGLKCHSSSWPLECEGIRDVREQMDCDRDHFQ